MDIFYLIFWSLLFGGPIGYTAFAIIGKKHLYYSNFRVEFLKVLCTTTGIITIFIIGWLVIIPQISSTREKEISSKSSAICQICGKPATWVISISSTNSYYDYAYSCDTHRDQLKENISKGRENPNVGRNLFLYILVAIASFAFSLIVGYIYYLIFLKE